MSETMWTPELFEMLEKIASRSDCYEDFKANFPKDLKWESFRKALKRHYDCTTLEFYNLRLYKDTYEKDLQVENLTPPPPVERKESYISDMQVFEASVLYQDHTITEVANILDLDVDNLTRLFKMRAITKSSVPKHPEARDAEELAQEIEKVREKITKFELDQKLIQHLRNENKKLKIKEQSYNTLMNNLKLKDDLFPLTSEESGHFHLIIPITDLHAGKRTYSPNQDTSSYLTKPQNEYSKTTLRSRVSRICTFIDNYISSQDNFKNESVTILILGDVFEALLGNMRPGQPIVVEDLGMDQWNEGVKALSSIIETVKECKQYYHIPKMNVVIIPGNHDRLTADKSFESEELIGGILTQLLHQKYSDPEQDIEVMFGPRTTSFMLGTTNVIAYHGHHSTLKTYDKIAAFIDIHGIKEAKRHLLVQGHLHNFQVQTGYDWRHVVLPSVCGNDAFNLNQIIRGAPPEFVMIKVFNGYETLVGPIPL